MLQLHIDGRRETTPIQLSWLQPRQGRSPQKKGAENTKEHNRKGVLFNVYQARSVLRGGSAEQRRATKAASSATGFGGWSSLSGKTECSDSCATERCRSVSSGYRCKQSTSRQYVESGDCSTENYDRVQWRCVRGRQNIGHYKNRTKSLVTKWPLESIGPSKS
jgi:hypothetical protein